MASAPPLVGARGRARLAPGDNNALMPAERRIADLAASGHRNPEITATLYITSVELNGL